MNFIPQSIPEIILIEPQILGDHRGYFVETFRQDKFEQAVDYKVNFCQDNESKSTKGVLRGLHYQLPPYEQSKLVRVIEGEVLDVTVDIRQGSPTYLQHIAVKLDSIKKQQLFIPRGFAHGFVVLSEQAVYTYKVDNYFSSENIRGIAFDSDKLKIDWILPHDQLTLSDKDRNHPDLPVQH
ncbi:dTDP-4-dehydrorhamnose 3,5-epimerase [Thiomicrospira pelophila]|uniref:dTDP-4-dehydrorhamnose 3,5-epimerase n=1 Tax=Thiomicrospira pelophila TaxID=934 RepID=UPI0004A73045|nr:dTDP-4-dehydrorhamnose 3,5-epimerase [Thiomicrospira pelophila]